MADDIQNLLERIQKDGVDKAEAEAGRIVAAAKAKAEAMTAEAKKTAEAIVKKAEEDSAAFAERATKAIEQAARDVLLSLAGAIDATLKRIVHSEVSGALAPDTLKQMLARVVEAYCGNASGNSRIEMLLRPDQQKQLADFLMSKFGAKLRSGLEIKADDTVISGFRVSVVNENLRHDFSAEAITDALCRFLRPRLAEIVKGAQ